MLPARASALVTGLRADRARVLTGGDTGHTWRVQRTGAPDVLIKQPPHPDGAMLEVAGLRWLADGGLPTPHVLGCDEGLLALQWVSTAHPEVAAARAFGIALATVHGSNAEAFGVAPPGVEVDHGFVGAVRVPFGSWATWPEHYVNDRLQPTAQAAARAGRLGTSDLAAITDLCSALLERPGSVVGPPSQPTRIHGDLWSGNLLWQDDQVLVIDPAACGGHPETDLAMLHLFGAPLLAEIVAAYDGVRPLDPDWRDRIPLHQVFPLLVHAAMFGGGYGSSAGRAARVALATRN